MAAENLPGGLDRHTYQKTRYRGLNFRYAGNGSKIFHGYIPGRGRVRLQARAEREALAEWNELRGKAGNGETIPKRNVKLGPWIEEWFERKKRRLRDSTATEYRAALDLVHLPFLGHRRLIEIGADVISDLQFGLKDRGLNYVDRKRPLRPLSTAQVENYLKPLRGCFRSALRHKLIAVNPFDLLTEEDRLEDDGEEFVYKWSDEEIEKVLAEAQARDRRPEGRQEYAPLIHSAIETGLRLGELTGAEWGDLDLEASVWSVTRQWTKAGAIGAPKTKKGIRRVPLTPEFVRYLKALKLRSPFSQDGDPVFVALGRGGSREGGGTRLSHRNVQRRAWQPIREALDLPDKVTFHQLRHAFASRAAHRGVTKGDLAEFMGHSETRITELYVHLYGDEQEQREERFRQAMAQAQ